MVSTSEVPAWLQGNSNENTNDAANPIVSSTMKDAEMTAVDIETPATNKDDNVHIPSTEQTSRCSKVKKCMGLTISACLFLIFIGSSVVQDNDTGGTAILYLIFYALHAVVAGAYFFSHFIFRLRLSRFVLGLGSGMLIWSIVFVILSSVQYSNTFSADDITDAGGDNPNATKKEEIAYEIAGAALGAVSALYHVGMARKSSSA